ncbi:hypothetical protein [Enterococcus gallinarum]
MSDVRRMDEAGPQEVLDLVAYADNSFELLENYQQIKRWKHEENCFVD